MNIPAQMDRAIDSVYDTKGLLFIAKEGLVDLQGLLKDQNQEQFIAGTVHSLNIVIRILGLTIDDIEDVVKDHAFVRKDGGELQ